MVFSRESIMGMEWLEASMRLPNRTVCASRVIAATNPTEQKKSRVWAHANTKPDLQVRIVCHVWEWGGGGGGGGVYPWVTGSQYDRLRGS
jgi:hypothetical protein